LCEGNEKTPKAWSGSLKKKRASFETARKNGKMGKKRKRKKICTREHRSEDTEIGQASAGLVQTGLFSREKGRNVEKLQLCNTATKLSLWRKQLGRLGRFLVEKV
jgi:hypothetical protein